MKHCLYVQVGRTCTSVRTLIAARCPGITLNSMHGFPELRHLDLTGCEGIAPATAVCPLPCPPYLMQLAQVFTSHLPFHALFPTILKMAIL